MTKSTPRVLKKVVEYSCPWFDVVVKDVQVDAEMSPEKYYSIETADYNVILAVTREGTIPIVRQYRPAIERDLLELPAGNGEAQESPEETARRELLEETGCVARELVPLGMLVIDSGRMATVQHAFFAPDVEVTQRPTDHEEIQEVLFVKPKRLRSLVARGKFAMASHLAVVCEAVARGLIEL